MRAPQPLGNDDVEALADGLGGRKAEQALGTAVPQPDQAVAIRENDRVGRALADGAIELCDCVSIVHA